MGQEYACKHCGATRAIDEDPITGPDTVRIGCEDCATMRQHMAVGRVAFHLHHGVPTYGGER